MSRALRTLTAQHIHVAQHMPLIILINALLKCYYNYYRNKYIIYVGWYLININGSVVRLGYVYIC